MPDEAVDAADAERADSIRSQFSVPNEIYQISTLLSIQIALLQDIRIILCDLLGRQLSRS